MHVAAMRIELRIRGAQSLKEKRNIVKAVISHLATTFGVAVDAAGVLSVKTLNDPDGRLRAQRIAAAKQGLPADVRRPGDRV